MTKLARRPRAKKQSRSPAFWMLVGVGGAASCLALAGYLWRRAWGITPTPTTPDTSPSRA